jgi:cyclomaltodextrin glucanotransferase
MQKVLSPETLTCVGRLAGSLHHSGSERNSFLGMGYRSKATVRVQLNGLKTEPGDTVFLMGDCPELGEWDVRKCVPLEYVNPNMWFTEIVFTISAGKVIAYKYALLHSGKNGALQQENRPTRTRTIPADGVTKWQDTWERQTPLY